MEVKVELTEEIEEKIRKSVKTSKSMEFMEGLMTEEFTSMDRK